MLLMRASLKITARKRTENEFNQEREAKMMKNLGIRFYSAMIGHWMLIVKQMYFFVKKAFCSTHE